MNALQLCRWQFSHKKFCSRLSSSEVQFYTEIGPFAFLRPSLGDLGATNDDHLRLIEKRVVDFLLMLIELFSLDVTAEALRTNIGWKSATSLQRGPVDPKFQVEGVAPTNHSSSQKTRLSVSPARTAEYGVPQSSVLGPLLFVLCTADLELARRHGVEAHFYADDSQLYIFSKPSDATTAEDRLLRCLDDMAAWMKSNRLCLNPSNACFPPSRNVT